MSAATEPRQGRAEPLWDRVDRNRVKVGIFVALFVLAGAISLGALVAVAGLVLGVGLMPTGSLSTFFGAYPYLVAGGVALGAALGAVHVARTLTSPARTLPKRFGARLSDTGTLLPQKSALHDMALATGYRYAPPLWIIDDCDRVNAFAVGLSERNAIIGVTRGFVDRLSTEAQRAVFANLMARLKNGDTMSATAVSAVMGPIWAARENQFRKQEEPDDPLETLARSRTTGFGDDGRSRAVLSGFVIEFLAVLITEALMAGHERAAHAASEKADAEGMLLLKDPEAMVRALREVLAMNNTVPGAGESYSMLFYCWAGFGYAPEDDPEMRRIGRLREVLGAGGA